MDTSILAILIQEGSRFASEYLRNRTVTRENITSDSLERYLAESDIRMSKFTKPQEPDEEPEVIETKKVQRVKVLAAPKAPEPEISEEPTYAASIATGCVPCAMGHFGTCSGLLNEAIRFAHSPDGIASPEVADRVGMCLDELNAMERVDLRPEMIVQLSGWEKELAEKTLTESRATRHRLEALEDIDSLENIAATTQSTRKDIGRQWFQKKLSNLSPEDKEEINSRIMAKIEALANEEAEGTNGQ